jgi:hypothetical protein
MNFNPDQLKTMFVRDAVVAGYGILASTVKKATKRVIGPTVGETGMNVVSLVAGTGLAQTSNKHLHAVGGALRIGTLAHMGNSLVESVIGRSSENRDSK